MNRNIPTGSGYRRHIGSGLDLIRNDRISGAFHLFNAADFNNIGARAPDVRAHGIQKVSQIHNMGLSGSIFNHGHAVRLYRGQHNIHSGSNGNHIQINIIAG